MMLRALLLLVVILLARPAIAQAPAPVAEYRLGAGDVVRISVYQNADLLLETRVSESGQISYPLLGSVKIGGLSPSAAEQLIAEGLMKGNFVKQPQVTVIVMQVRAHQANVLGQVNKPGRYPLESAGMLLSDLLALAGGTTAYASETVVLSGLREGKPYRAEVELPSVFAPGGRVKDLEVRSGDVIWIDRVPQIYIYGEVQRAGTLRLERGMTLMQALAGGGGLTQRGTERGIRVHRKNAQTGKIEVLQPAMDEVLKEGDVVFVKESLF